jgi:hypothetical protein
VPQHKHQKKKPKISADNRLAVVMEPEERKKLRAVRHLTSMRDAKKRVEREKKKEKLQAFLKQKQKAESTKAKITKENRKEIYKLGGYARAFLKTS